MRCIEWWHFQLPWRTPNPVFKVAVYCKSNTPFFYPTRRRCDPVRAGGRTGGKPSPSPRCVTRGCRSASAAAFARRWIKLVLLPFTTWPNHSLGGPTPSSDEEVVASSCERVNINGKLYLYQCHLWHKRQDIQACTMKAKVYNSQLYRPQICTIIES